MEIVNNSFSYTVVGCSDGLSLAELRLRDAAIAAAKSAYAPYSNFFVGAAILLNDDTIVIGNNQENGAYPSGLCAERVAIFSAHSRYPKKKIVQMAIVALVDNHITINPITPCGGCRQVLLESANRQQKPFKLLLIGREETIRIEDASSLMPLPFKFVKE